MRNNLLQRFLLFGSLLCPAMTVVHADTISAFNFSATFLNGATGTGLLNIDVTTGMVTSLSVGVTGTSGPTYNFGGPLIQGDSGSYYTVGFATGDSGLVVSFPQTTLVGYTGGQLCSTSVACPGSTYPDTLYGTNATGNVNASSAALTAVAAPEIDPSLGYGSMVMLAGMTAVIRGRKRTSAV